jgi:His-Xaa-Ser system protein HxsD
MSSREVKFDVETCSIDALQRALYRMSDRVVGEITTKPRGGHISCHLSPLNDADVTDAVVAEFRIEALDEVLRARVREETREVRNLILAVAFSKSGLINDDEVQAG